MSDKVKQSRFPASLFWTVFGMLLLTAGLNVALILLGLNLSWPSIFSVHLILFYWICVSALIVLYIRRKIHKTYEIPLQEISRATEKVSQGDFSIQIPAINPPEKYDYLDIMILDLNKMINDLNGIETLKTDFISNVSHELKTPLSVMQNYATMLQSPDLDEKSRLEYAKAVSSSCRRLTALVTNILKLNKLENQQIYPKVAPYDIGERLRESILSFEEAWTAKNLELEADIADGIMVTTDGELLSLVWNNFLSNAIKFTPEGGRILVSLTRMEGDLIRISVKDSGCGMDEHTRNRVFEKFFQGDTSHATQGNGLGLALAARVAAICGGKIGVESEPGKGSEFYFTF
ncbi:MAG: HAMP domain-containing histidine kinase [Treponema sp.]|nr:HAMP domain-containing histidine kinase [Treponema sp.]